MSNMKTLQSLITILSSLSLVTACLLLLGCGDLKRNIAEFRPWRSNFRRIASCLIRKRFYAVSDLPKNMAGFTYVTLSARCYYDTLLYFLVPSFSRRGDDDFALSALTSLGG